MHNDTNPKSTETKKTTISVNGNDLLHRSPAAKQCKAKERESHLSKKFCEGVARVMADDPAADPTTEMLYATAANNKPE